jgi:hypothetical protein
MRRPILLNLLLPSLLLCACALAGGSGPRVSSTPEQLQRQLGQTLQTADDAINRGEYLRAVALTEVLVQSLAVFPDLQNYPRQTLGFYQSSVGQDAAARQSFDFGQTGSSIGPDEEQAIGESGLKSAVQAIVQAARGQRVVILNEVHYLRQSREFARRVALALRKEGFTHFAAETFAPGIAGTQALGYPTHANGYYTNEPVFGELVRSVIKAGYTLIPYEAETFKQGGSGADQINDRETQEANNLNERIFKQDPSARVFIYVGYSHNLESVQNREGTATKWMALRLRELTGIDPLTIDQTEGLQIAGPTSNPALRAAVLRLKRPQTVSVLTDAQGNPRRISPFQERDLQVFHPDTKLIAGRPSWLFGAGRQAVTVTVPATQGAGRRLLQAFYKQEGPTAIPADQVVLSGPGRMTLLLLPGTYRLAVQDETGQSTSPLPEPMVPAK